METSDDLTIPPPTLWFTLLQAAVTVELVEWMDSTLWFTLYKQQLLWSWWSGLTATHQLSLLNSASKERVDGQYHRRKVDFPGRSILEIQKYAGGEQVQYNYCKAGLRSLLR